MARKDHRWTQAHHARLFFDICAQRAIAYKQQSAVGKRLAQLRERVQKQSVTFFTREGCHVEYDLFAGEKIPFRARDQTLLTRSACGDFDAVWNNFDAVRGKSRAQNLIAHGIRYGD